MIWSAISTGLALTMIPICLGIMCQIGANAHKRRNSEDARADAAIRYAHKLKTGRWP